MSVDETIDRLYGLPAAEFTEARNEAARELRKAGDREAADQVKALRKPTAAAGAVNRLVREHRGAVERFLRAAAVLREAQFSGKGDRAAATRKEHEELDKLVGLGGEAVRPTLLAAAVDDDAARQLLEARLERELEPAGFGTLLAYAPSAPVKLSDATARQKESDPPAKRKVERDEPGRKEPGRRRLERKEPDPVGPDDSAARARLEDARTALGAAEAEERQARRHWDETQKELEKARAAVEQAERDLDRLHQR